MLAPFRPLGSIQLDFAVLACEKGVEAGDGRKQTRCTDRKDWLLAGVGPVADVHAVFCVFLGGSAGVRVSIFRWVPGRNPHHDGASAGGSPEYRWIDP